MNKIDKSTAIAKISQDLIDDYMRQVAYNNCEIEPKCNPFCGKAGKCIIRSFVNIFWRRMAQRN